MEFRNLLSHVPSGLLDNYADPHNTQQYWIDSRSIGRKIYYTVYKGSFPNEERKVMTFSGNRELSFYIDETKIAEGKNQSRSCLFLNKDYKLYATESFDNVSLRRYDSVVSHNRHLMQSEKVKEMDLISDITVKSSFCKETVVIANPYFKSVKSYNNCCELLVQRMSGLMALMLLMFSLLTFLVVLLFYINPNSIDYLHMIVRIFLIILCSCSMIFILALMYLLLQFLCKGGKREVLLELVGIGDESPYATINFKWESTCGQNKPREIICHRDIDLKQLLTLVVVSVHSISLLP